jgi:cytoplasmic iron level regulating protein YaaA (DUF328/UPF0246 family)
MMLIISPAKKLDFKPVDFQESTQIRFTKETRELARVMKKQTPQDLIKLMDISKALADLNVQRYQDYDPKMPESRSKQALFAFNGDVYAGLKSSDFDRKDILFAQKHLRILSGLYGLLKPLDRIQEYRLEMGSALEVGNHKSLYSFWGNKVTDLLNQDMAENKDKILINLASEEYFHVIHPDRIKGKLIHIRFEEKRGKDYKVISFSAKKARGLMARFIIKNKLTRIEDLKAFDSEKYQFHPGRSRDDQLTFVR